ncbi:MAG: isochorismatase family protein [Chloroflexota bacterium]|nr:isochorismatase family protein [Chloroflexota bacterium]
MVDPDERYLPTSALIIVDVQNDFADPAGGLRVAGGAEVVPVLNFEIARARAAGALVVYTQDWHPLSTPHFAKDGGIWPVHCIAGSWGAELHPSLVVDGPLVRKGSNGEDGYSGFRMRDPRSGEESSTELETILQDHGTERVVVGGLATDYCVKATALDAARLGHPTAVLGAGIRAVDLAQGDGERALAELAAAGIAILPEEPR